MISRVLHNAALFMLAVLALALVACGTDAAPAPVPTATSTATLPTATPEPPPTPTTVPPSPTTATTTQAIILTAMPEVAPLDAEVERLGQAAMETLTYLTNDLSPRASGTEEEVVAAEYLRAEFAALGYEASIQPFEVRSISPFERLLTVDEPKEMDIQAFPMWMTAAGVVTAEVIDVGKALADDIPSGGLAGKIALIERGEISFDEKVTTVFEAGAVGVIVYNNEPGPFVGALGEETIPAVAISQEDGGTLKGLLGDGPVTATIRLEYTEESRNVIADKPGTAGDGRAVVLGGHYDTVPNVPGANDNGSGIATLLTIAREIAGREYPFTVRFIAFGAEELGLYGSNYYVDQLSDEEIDSTVAMLNFDALGSGARTATLGTLSLQRFMEEHAEERGIDIRISYTMDWGSSDHAAFHEAGIDHIFFLGEDFSRIHTPDDKLEFVETELLGNAAFLGMALLDMLAADEE
ncbi:MAG: M20/M25/M40 family metallo-hydrolase [Dehalococcoidia bacterium]|nr:M20/M25/M40 family metallo-hydrolase [Dehalococcoidia bacterium]